MSETQPQDYFTTPEPSEWNTVSTSNAGSPPSHFIAPVDATVAEGVSEGLLPSQTVFSPSLQPSSLHSPLPETNLWNSWLSSHDMTATMGSSTGDPPFDSLHASEPTYRIQNQHSLPSLPNPSTYTPTAVGVLGPADANTNTPESILDLHVLLNVPQLRQRLQKEQEEVRSLRLEGLNLARRTGTAIARLSDHHRMVMLLAEHDIPRLRALLQQAISDGASITAITNKLQQALEGAYHPRGFTGLDLDLGVLVYHIGGRSLLYALSHSLGLPALRTLRNNMSFTKLMPTVGTITSAEVAHNIQNGIIQTRASAERTKKRGISVLIDEIALEEMAVHFKHANSVGGLCWKHSPQVDLVLRTFDSALNLARALADGKVHLGKEMTVAAVSCFGENGTYPILMAPTCKQETAPDMEFIFNLILDTWEREGRSAGDIWSFATDGDATRRHAGYSMFVRIHLDPSSPLYGILSNIPGLNLFTGVNGITLDFDYKHLLKRLCTLLRLSSGITLNNGRIINPTMLARYLGWLPDYDRASVNNLLYPDDPQDVPRAVELMQAIIKLGKLQIPNPHDVNTIGDMDALKLMAAVLESILTPFMDISISLAGQVTSLSTYAHLAFSLFRTHRTLFMSNQLYGDSQTMVKNAIFCIAKQQQLDANEPFYLFDLGDDRLERLFGRIRMLGAHDSGINYHQGIDRLGHAVDIDTIFMRNPQLDPGSRRIKMDRVEGVDHLNAKTWKGNVVAGNCDIPSAWLRGRQAAIRVLSSSQMSPSAYDYATIFSDRDFDFLRPFGQGKYPGIESDHDRSMDFDKIIGRETASGSDPHSESAAIPTTGVPSSTSDSPVEHTQAPNSVSSGASDSDSLPHDHLVTLEEAFSNPSSTEVELTGTVPSGPGIDPADYIQYKGRWIHKQSVCRIVINSGYAHKLVNRLHRVCGFTKVNRKRHLDVDSDDILDPDTFPVGDPILTLLRCEKTLSLALLRTTAINDGTTLLAGTKLATLMSQKAEIKVSGQIVTLIPMSSFQAPSSTLSHSSTSTPDDFPSQNSSTDSSELEPLASQNHHKDLGPSESASWIWSGGYVKTDTSMRGTTESTEKPVVVTVPGYLTQYVNPNIFDVDTNAGNGRNPRLSEVNSAGKTWLLDAAAASTACESLWRTILDTKTPLTALISVKASDAFPYRATDGSYGLVCEPGTHQLAVEHGERVKRSCHFCGQVPDNWRAHMGAHILRSMRGVQENLTEPIGLHKPCGFCGRSGEAGCPVTLKIKNHTTKIECGCQFDTPFKYGFANKGSDATPCRNVPVVCTLCPGPSNKAAARPAIWRYNMATHLQEQHSEYASPGKPIGLPLPHALWKDMEITAREERALGIPEALIPPEFTQFRHEDPDEPPGPSAGSKRKGQSSRMSTNDRAKRARRGDGNRT
ncbi:hypothetical protein B0H21DRAFT_892357 [Amylocystis lapponica]|nr:hypothetical protein B0H21DRAFT_892357 [Amylocystis lapponica]